MPTGFFDDLIPGAKPKAAARAPTAVEGRRLQNAATGESIQSANVNQAQGETALQKERATMQAQIAKTQADAQKSALELIALQQQQGFLNLKDQQALAAARAVLMMSGERMYGKAVAGGYEPTALRNQVASVAEGIPFMPSGFGQGVGDFIRDPVSEMGKQGERVFTEGALRTVTGAAGPQEERPETKMQYFPSAWQSRNDKLRAEMAALRTKQIATSKAVAGPALGVEGKSQSTSGAEVVKKPTQAMLQQYAMVPAAKKLEARKRFEAAGYDVSGLR